VYACVWSVPALVVIICSLDTSEHVLLAVCNVIATDNQQKDLLSVFKLFTVTKLTVGNLIC